MPTTLLSSTALLCNSHRELIGHGVLRDASAAAKFERSSASPHLTPRQLEVLALLCEGLPNKLICRRLTISAGTTKAHIGAVLRELGVGSRLQAVIEAKRRGIVGSDS